ncbi:MAG: hypothetical protein QXH71_02015 [Candidatus Anstonellaceae archaeon]
MKQDIKYFDSKKFFRKVFRELDKTKFTRLRDDKKQIEQREMISEKYLRKVLKHALISYSQKVINEIKEEINLKN